jgi:hypothetical protein
VEVINYQRRIVMAYESDNPHFDNLINNMDSDEVPYKVVSHRMPIEKIVTQMLRIYGKEALVLEINRQTR